MRRASQITSIVLLATLGLSLCSCSHQRFYRLEPGMSKNDVRNYIGEPKSIVYADDFANGQREVWFYERTNLQNGKFEARKITFERGQVIAVETDPKRELEKRAEPGRAKLAKQLAAEVPPDVGFYCEKNSDCRSLRCVDRRCAGPNDCVRGIDAPCLSDLDCCSGQCNESARVCELRD